MEPTEAVFKGQKRRVPPRPSPLQQHGTGAQGTGGGGDGDISPDTFLAGSWMVELEGRRAGGPRGDASPVPREKRCWGLAQLLGSRPSPGDRSSSSSICTEDFAARFWEGMVEPLLSEEEDEPAGDVPTEGDDSGQDESLFPAGRRLDVRRQLAVEPGRRPLQGRSPRLMRRESLESLGGRISRLSRSDALGVAWGGPHPAPSMQPALGWEDSPHRRSCSGKDSLTIALGGENRAAEHLRRAPGISAGRSRAGARRGSPDGGLPGISIARSGGHPTSKPLGLRRQEPPALQGRRGGVVTPAVDGVEKEGARSRQRRAPCPAHRTDTAAGPPGRYGTGADVSSCPGGAAESRWQRGKQKAMLPGERVTGQPVSLRWSLQRSQEGTRELGTGAKGTRSEGDRARAGPAHARDACRRDAADLERTGQRACADCQKGLERERRKTSALQEEKRELQKRLRELEHRIRSLLRQRREALDRLHVLLQKEKMDALRQLREALEQPWVCKVAPGLS
ncbi:uncharacterized protein LOC115346482 [Aquila chrysaetos chrysaetos]|uniref:uncharacterized protein LOC115346482 n=1 Tax=Aquila chrysaetos chrysaetos TaxID=223781 RepID=UPI001B7D4337|nr:uncharacterized protein LOC115346482 [Aquila chrysaetos chrysaetos]